MGGFFCFICFLQLFLLFLLSSLFLKICPERTLIVSFEIRAVFAETVVLFQDGFVNGTLVDGMAAPSDNVFSLDLNDFARQHLHFNQLANLAFQFGGLLCFELLPGQLLSVFTRDADVLSIGSWGFRVIGWSFLPMILALTYPVYFEAIGRILTSSVLTLLRTVGLFVPLGYLFSTFGLSAFWFTFPVTELVTALAGFLFYHREMSGK